jgi:uncharacterized cysteine cluster protein YcgN (CxxCxxCC family)
MSWILSGKCGGGLCGCDGGCCRDIVYENGVKISETYCKHYNTENGLCMIYDIRDEMGFTGCNSYPNVNIASKNGLPKGCTYCLEKSNKE